MIFIIAPFFWYKVRVLPANILYTITNGNYIIHTSHKTGKKSEKGNKDS